MARLKALDQPKVVRRVSKIFEGIFGDTYLKHNIAKISFAPSTLFYGHGRCARYWSFAFSDEFDSAPTKKQERLVMDTGSAIHGLIQDELGDNPIEGLQIEVEEPIDTQDPPFRGFIDAVVRGEFDAVIEIKTTKHDIFQYRKESNTPAKYHVGQVVVYMYATGIDQAVIVYVSRDTLERHYILVEMGDYMDDLRELIDWTSRVKEAIDEGKLPTVFPGHRSNSKACKQCPFKSTCGDAPKGDIVIEKLGVFE